MSYVDWLSVIFRNQISTAAVTRGRNSNAFSGLMHNRIKVTNVYYSPDETMHAISSHKSSLTLSLALHTSMKKNLIYVASRFARKLGCFGSVKNAYARSQSPQCHAINNILLLFCIERFLFN